MSSRSVVAGVSKGQGGPPGRSLRGRTDPLQQCLEPRTGPKRVHPGINSREQQSGRVLSKAAFKERHCTVRAAERDIHGGQHVGGHAALAGLAWDLGADYVLFPPQPRELLPEIVAGLLGHPEGRPHG